MPFEHFFTDNTKKNLRYFYFLFYCLQTISKLEFYKIFDYLYHDDNSFITETSKTEIQNAIKYEFFTSLTHLLLDLNYIANFFLYFFSGSKFRAQLFAMLGCCQKKPSDFYTQNHYSNNHTNRNNNNTNAAQSITNSSQSVAAKNQIRRVSSKPTNSVTSSSDRNTCGRFFSKCWPGKKTTTTTNNNQNRQAHRNHPFYEKISLTDQKHTNNNNFLSSNINGISMMKTSAKTWNVKMVWKIEFFLKCI